MKSKDHQPERTCVGCFKRFPQQQLLAIKRLKDGTVTIDFEDQESGRSVYLCKKMSCFHKAIRRKGKNALEYGLHVKIPEDTMKELENFFAKL